MNPLNVTHLVGVKGVVDWEVGEKDHPLHPHQVCHVKRVHSSSF